MLRLVCSRLAARYASCSSLLRLQSNSAADVDLANQELDEFFGVANTAAIATAGTSSAPGPITARDGAGQQPWSAEATAQAHSRAQRGTGSQSRGAMETLLESCALPAGEGSLTHTDASGRATMVDVAQKPPSERIAEASAVVHLGEAAFKLVQENNIKKGDVLTVAQLAGIMGAKSTANLIPLCHPVALTKADVQLSLQPEDHTIRISSMAKTVGQTGVEMEALTAAAVAALTVYDMCKAVSKDISINTLRLDFKSGGKSGVFRR